jgi:DNA-binding XRE family transcriptional regulator
MFAKNGCGFMIPEPGEIEMDAEKKKRLAEKGWVSTSVQDFLGLSPDDMAYIELKLQLSRALKARRNEKGLTQAALAELIKSSQSRVAKMEKSDETVSVDLLVRSLFALDATIEDIAQALTAA